MLNDKGQFSKRDGKKLAAELYELHQQIRGPNWHASYPYARGSVHSKVMILKYTNFLLVLITSCNFLQCDFEFSDNVWSHRSPPRRDRSTDDRSFEQHWFIMSFPLLPQPAIDNSQITPFERILLRHTNELDCPKEFIDDIFGKYDYSQTVNRIHLVVSEPDVSHDPELYGILRLGELARELLPPAVVEKKEVNLEICTASLGAFQLDWVKQVSWLLSGRPLEGLLERIKKEKVDKLKIPEWTVVYAAKETVKKCSEDVQRVRLLFPSPSFLSVFPSCSWFAPRTDRRGDGLPAQRESVDADASFNQSDVPRLRFEGPRSHVPPEAPPLVSDHLLILPPCQNRLFFLRHLLRLFFFLYLLISLPSSPPLLRLPQLLTQRLGPSFPLREASQTPAAGHQQLRARRCNEGGAARGDG